MIFESFSESTSHIHLRLYACYFNELLVPV